MSTPGVRIDLLQDTIAALAGHELPAMLNGQTFKLSAGQLAALARVFDGTGSDFNFSSDELGAALREIGDALVAQAVSQTEALTAVETALEEILADPWWFYAIEELVPLRSTNFLPPKDKGYRYVLLTAGETGSGDYNEGILTSESVTGSAPLVQATAEIDLATSPLHGQTIHLINTEGRVLRGSTSPGTVQNDQMQQITGAVFNNWTGTSDAPTGAFTWASGDNTRPAGGSQSTRNITFNSANSPDARTGNETRAKNIGVVHVMRLK